MKRDCIDTWRTRGRIPVPSKSGVILDLIIVRLYEVTSVDGLPLDLLIEARATHLSTIKRFGMVFSDSRPQDNYTIPILWWPPNDLAAAWL